MRLRRILVAHHVRIFRNMVKHYVLSEFSDAVVVEASTDDKAFEKIENQHFDLALVDADSVSSNPAFLDNFRARSVNRTVALIGIISPDSPETVQCLTRAGMDYFLQIPFLSNALKELVNKACNPRNWRINERFYIPDAGVILHGGQGDVMAKLINISKGGVLCEVAFSDNLPQMFKEMEATITISESEFSFEIKRLTCRLSRLNISNWTAEGEAGGMRITLLFSDLSVQAEALIDQALGFAREKYSRV
ncbi:MAG: hypothetical protein KKE17_00255 [Proteobacteria bacterium]|nr:hypothetical protein [Pseudomonadota bacterium]MBU1708415.1 hypothetical protein [Pseudomonadota bacterium]